jgi:7-keto-8-aminopelargonate synthetase-like enzyme
MEDLERVLKRIVHSGRSMPLTRRFIVCEGISQTRGSIAPLRQIHNLKTKYKFRLVVDESLSFGVCGASGRGACEAAGLAPDDVEIITGVPCLPHCLLCSLLLPIIMCR